MVEPGRRFLIMIVILAGLVFVFPGIELPSHELSENDAKETIRKAIDAYGGPEKVKKMTCFTLKAKGAFLNDGQKLPYMLEAWFSFPSRRKAIYRFDDKQAEPLTQILNAESAWEKRSETTRQLNEDELAAMKEAMYRFQVDTLLAIVTDKSLQISYAGEKEVDQKRAVGVKVHSNNHLDILLYFDVQSGLQVKVEIRSTDAAGKEAILEYFLRDHKEFNTVRRPSKFDVFINGDKKEEFEITDMEFPERIEEKVFKKP
jgi:hypothetical protein